MYDILQLNEMLVPELREVASSLKLKGISRLDKQELIYKILDKQALNEESAAGSAEPAAEKKPRRTRKKKNAESD